MPEPYAPRRTEPLAPWKIPGARLRVWWVDVEGAEAPPCDVLAAAKHVAREALPGTMAAEGGSAGLGFAVIHRGTAGARLLRHWWAHGDICCQRLFHSAPETTAFAPMADRAPVPSVCELAVIAAERQAWIDTMMWAAPDPEADLAVSPAAPA
ncbi:MAG: hypothetical protein GVY27_04235 [Deinococcus-Thermus bacterium]|jgi:hypothetical protein|nr:hypothetical protein [Deinococcota bacterium]